MNTYHENLAALYRLNILDTEKDSLFDNLAKLASNVCDSRFAFITFADADHIWFKASFGLDIKEIPFKDSFCERTIQSGNFFEVPNAHLDAHFCNNNLVINEPNIVFYAGYPLKTFSNSVVGTLCVLDTKEKRLTDTQRESLRIIAGQVENLLESKERFQGFVDNSSDIIYELDSHGKFVFLSPSIIKILGYLPDELIDKSFKLIVHEDNLPECEAFLARLVAEGEVNEVIEYRVRHKDGHYEWHESKCSVIRRNEGIFIMGIAREVTAWKKAQNELKHLNESLQKKADQLKESEKRYSDLFLESPQPMWLYDLETYKFIQVNKAAIARYGYTEEELLNMYVWQLRADDEQGKARDYHQANTYGNTSFNVKRRHQTKNKEVVEVELYSNLVVLNGKDYRLVITVDITEKNKHLRAIEEQNKKFREIAWIQSHVVRHPLVNIMGLIGLIKEQPLEYLKKNDVLKHLTDELNKMDSVIREISDKAKLAEQDYITMLP